VGPGVPKSQQGTSGQLVTGGGGVMSSIETFPTHARMIALHTKEYFLYQ